tara:strand:+ start:2080 stop:2907 length:828 start_codon:yes stop_codon:yes gene_type:complete
MKLTNSSLIIACYNEGENINLFFDNFKEQTVYPREIILVDGGSTDESVNLLKKVFIHPKVIIKIIVNKLLNKKHSIAPIAEARNEAIAAASYENILVSDLGCKLDKHFIEELSNSLVDSKIVAGRYLGEGSNDLQKKLNNIFIPSLSKFKSSDFLPSSRSIAFKKKCWKKVSGYPVDSYTAEDTLFAMNLRRKYGNFTANPNAIVYWYLPATIEELEQKVKQYGEGDRVQNIYKLKYMIKYFLVFTKLSIIYSLLKNQNLLIHQMYSFEVKGYFN